MIGHDWRPVELLAWETADAKEPIGFLLPGFARCRRCGVCRQHGAEGVIYFAGFNCPPPLPEEIGEPVCVGPALVPLPASAREAR